MSRPLTPDTAFHAALALAGLGGIFLLGGIAWVVGSMSWDAMVHTGPLAFLTGTRWDPVAGEFGALPALVGTILTSLLAMALAVPLGFGVAVFLSEVAPARLAAPLSALVDLLAAIPSVIYGLWGLFVLAPAIRDYVQPLLQSLFPGLPLVQGPPLGVGILCASVVLAIMILPVITSVAREVLRAVPHTHREAALALGATRHEVVRHILFPTARSGLLGASVLGLGRALGETMAVTMVIGNRHDLPSSLFDPGYTLAAVIANEFTEAFSPLYLSALAGLAVVLMGTTLMLNAGARLLVLRVRERLS